MTKHSALMPRILSQFHYNVTYPGQIGTHLNSLMTKVQKMTEKDVINKMLTLI